MSRMNSSSKVTVSDLNENSSRDEKKPKKKPAKDPQIVAIIDQIWPLYDEDNSGNLDKDETRKFVKQYMEASGFNMEDFDDDIFEEMFIEFDEDGSGQIEKDELYNLLAKFMGKTKKKKKVVKKP